MMIFTTIFSQTLDNEGGRRKRRLLPILGSSLNLRSARLEKIKPTASNQTKKRSVFKIKNNAPIKVSWHLYRSIIIEHSIDCEANIFVENILLLFIFHYRIFFKSQRSLIWCRSIWILWLTSLQAESSLSRRHLLRQLRYHGQSQCHCQCQLHHFSWQHTWWVLFSIWALAVVARQCGRQRRWWWGRGRGRWRRWGWALARCGGGQHEGGLGRFYKQELWIAMWGGSGKEGSGIGGLRLLGGIVIGKGWITEGWSYVLGISQWERSDKKGDGVKSV